MRYDKFSNLKGFHTNFLQRASLLFKRNLIPFVHKTRRNRSHNKVSFSLAGAQRLGLRRWVHQSCMLA